MALPTTTDYAMLCFIFALLSALVSTTIARALDARSDNGSYLASKICLKYERPVAFYCVTSSSFVVCSSALTQYEQHVAGGTSCIAAKPGVATNENKIVSYVLEGNDAQVWARDGINTPDDPWGLLE